MSKYQPLYPHVTKSQSREWTEAEFNKLSKQLAEDQRGEPEKAMLRIQMSQIAQLYGYMAEHIGDLTNRMAEDPSSLRGGYEFVKKKVDRIHEVMGNRYGYEREVREQIHTNLPYLKNKDGSPKYRSEREALEKLRELGKDYAEAHSRLTGANLAQRTARDAAVDFGNWYFAGALRHVDYLKHYTDKGREAWEAYALSREKGGLFG
ncbi:MAG: hypothetical protein PHI12_06665 [Dehalococcoidales bacterium]|nr:hypothetical protein [Dehalococcoidales bacterium]